MNIRINVIKKKYWLICQNKKTSVLLRVPVTAESEEAAKLQTPEGYEFLSLEPR